MNSKRMYESQDPIYMKGYIILGKIGDTEPRKGERAFHFFLIQLKEYKNLENAIKKTEEKFNIKMSAEEQKAETETAVSPKFKNACNAGSKKTYVIWVA